MSTPTGKRGTTLKGYSSQVRRLKAQRIDTSELESKMFRVTIHKCELCPHLFNSEGARNQHFRRVHMRSKRYCWLRSVDGDYYCKICGPNSRRWKDSRSLRKHYTDRTIHSPYELAHSGVEAWLLDGLTRDDKEEIIVHLEGESVLVPRSESTTTTRADDSN